MNKKLNAKDLIIVGVCLLLLTGLTGSAGGILGGIVSPALLIGSIAAFVAAPFSRNKNKEAEEKNKEPRSWGDLE